jgi:hypothetical protein
MIATISVISNDILIRDLVIQRNNKQFKELIFLFYSLDLINRIESLTFNKTKHLVLSIEIFFLIKEI